MLICFPRDSALRLLQELSLVERFPEFAEFELHALKGENIHKTLHPSTTKNGGTFFAQRYVTIL